MEQQKLRQLVTIKDKELASRVDVQKKGFTLVELITVVAILGILSAIGIIGYNGYISSTKKTSAKNIMQQMSLAQTEYFSNEGDYFVSGDTCSLSSVPTSGQSTGINDRLLESKTITEKLGYNMCVTTDSVDGNDVDYTIIASNGTCEITLSSESDWVMGNNC